MLCHRKNRKSDVDKKPDITNVGKTNVDQFKDSDRSSNISDLKLELRQVEGSCELVSAVQTIWLIADLVSIVQ